MSQRDNPPLFPIIMLTFMFTIIIGSALTFILFFPVHYICIFIFGSGGGTALGLFVFAIAALLGFILALIFSLRVSKKLLTKTDLDV